MMDGIRHDMDKDMKDMLVNGEDYITVLDWWMVLELDKGMTVVETRHWV
jgi:hypothetical protein